MAPIWPAADIEATKAFWERLGFSSRVHQLDYLIVWREPVAEIHFYRDRQGGPTWPDHGAYLRVADADAWRRAFAAAGLPDEGVPRLTGIEDKPWGMREFALVDPNGHLLRVGTPLPG
jgi:catechol 2,3-dioxygenase-like lactoylglutathione lyase family enzyme